MILEVKAVANADSAVAVGRWFKPGDSYYRGYRYEGGVLTDLGLQCVPNLVSADGTVAAGEYCPLAGQMFRWKDGVVESLGDDVGLLGDVSADGSVIVGQTLVVVGADEAFRWTELDGLESLGDLPGGDVHSEALGVSSDGLVIVGWGDSPGYIEEAFRWEGGVMVGLGDIPGGELQSQSVEVSDDHSVVLGNGIRSGYHCCEAFRWTAEAGIVGLGAFDGTALPLQGTNTSKADYMSADGRLVIGSALTPGGTQEDYIWDPAFGMRPLFSVLEQEFDLDPGLWAGKLENMKAISDDARVISGYGGAFPAYNWIAVLPHPPGEFGCNVKMSDVSYGTGETIQIETLRFANFGPVPLGTRLRLQFEASSVGTLDVLDIGADGSFAIPAGLNANVAPVALFTVQPAHPRGEYAFRCALEEVGTGRIQAEDRVPFQIE